MGKALAVVLALGLGGVLWWFGRTPKDSPDRRHAKIQVLLWSWILFGNLPGAFGYPPLGLVVAAFSLSGLFLSATFVQLVRARRERRA
jgi:hypothetical protein